MAPSSISSPRRIARSISRGSLWLLLSLMRWDSVIGKPLQFGLERLRPLKTRLCLALVLDLPSSRRLQPFANWENAVHLRRLLGVSKTRAKQRRVLVSLGLSTHDWARISSTILEAPWRLPPLLRASLELLAADELGKEPAGGKELVVSAILGYAPAAQHHDTVALPDGGEAVRDDQARAGESMP